MTEGLPEVRFVGTPDGPPKFVPELGIEVATFTQNAGGKRACLGHHVPLNMRGPFRPEMLANYDPEKEYRTDAYGYALCLGKTAEDKPCSKKAVNRYPRCNSHGGRLHPLDKLVEPTGEVETEEPMSRYQMFLANQITVEDLDDDELLAFGFRTATGRIFKPKNVPRAMVEKFTEAIFERALDKLKTNALAAANTLSSIMVDTSVEPQIRIKAATEILDRTLGKAPLHVSVDAKPSYLKVFEAISAEPLGPLDVDEVPAPDEQPAIEQPPNDGE